MYYFTVVQSYITGGQQERAMSAIQEPSEHNLAASVANAGVTVIDFWASCCTPCRAMAPEFEPTARLRARRAEELA